MQVSAYVLQQMEGVRGALESVLTGVTREEWVSAVSPGQNPVGFTAWHVPSIQDWAMNTWMRDLPTVRSRPEWQAKGMLASFLPFGMGEDVAVDVARATKPEDVLAYADAVLEDARVMLAALPANRFEDVPDNRAHLRDGRYEATGYKDEIADMFEQPYWRLFAGACTGHCRGHLGELELSLALMRAR
jgi:hypothetical protein